MWQNLLFQTITITTLLYTSIPNCRFENILSPQFLLNSPNGIFILF